MKIAVLGQTGQMARALAEADWANDELVFLGRDQADLLNPHTALSKLIEVNPDAVINAAAYTNVDGAEQDERTATIINGNAVGRIARWCASASIPFVHISTDYVLDGSGTAPHAPNARPAPHGAYGRSKLAGEVAVVAAQGPYAILRTAWVFSEFGANFAKTMLRVGSSRDSVSVVDDQIGGPTPARALADVSLAAVRTLTNDPSVSGIYHFSGHPEVSWAAFAEAIFEAADMNVEVIPVSTATYAAGLNRPLATRPANSRLECSATTQAFGVARPDWRSELARIVSCLASEPPNP